MFSLKALFWADSLWLLSVSLSDSSSFSVMEKFWGARIREGMGV